jgi:predicted TIM-barrel fold metal-dependent hydrolase
LYSHYIPIVLLMSWCMQAVRADEADLPQTAPPAMLPLDQFRPRSMLQVPRHETPHARHPVVDVHTHFGYRLRGSKEQLQQFVEVMNRQRIAVCASMDGTLPDGFARQQEFLWTDYPDRFVIFVNLDWQGAGDAERPDTWACNQPDFVRHSVMQLEQAAREGASGLKLFKQFGLAYRNADGSLVRIDDRRWDPIWQACGRLGLPVLMHTGDPAAFFLPVDATNERYEELSRRPEWSFFNDGDRNGDQFPTREELLAARNRVIERHRNTRFIGAHVANNAEELAAVSRWLDAYPNLYVELASRIGELGRQPYTARRFLTHYADRVLFGTDGPWPEARLRRYWQFLETYDEYFPYSEKEFPPQGFWNIYGVGLPDDVLARIYHQNAAKLIPGVKQRLALALPARQ